MNMRLLCCVALSCAFAAAQTKPAAPDSAALARSIFDHLSATQATNRAILQELAKAPPALEAASILATEAATQSKSIRADIEALDQHFETLSEARQSALRGAWAIAVIMNACAESARDAARLPPGRDRAGEIRTGTECALRRAGQLTEQLAPFRERPPSN